VPFGFDRMFDRKKVGMVQFEYGRFVLKTRIFY